MKNRKKIVASFLLAIMGLAIFPQPVLAESSTLEVKISTSSQAVKAEETFVVTVSLPNYDDAAVADIGGMQFDLPVDTEYLEYVEGSDKTHLKKESGDLASGAYNPITNQFIFMYVYMNAGEKPLPRNNGDVFSLTFKLLKDIPEGSTTTIPCTATIVATGESSEIIPTSVTPAQIHPSRSALVEDEKNPSAPSKEIPISLDPSGLLGWEDITLIIPEGIDEKGISTEEGPNGLLIRGEDLSSLTVLVKKGGQEIPVTINTNQKEVLLKEDENGSIIAQTESGDLPSDTAGISQPDGALSDIPLPDTLAPTADRASSVEKSNNFALIIGLVVGISAITIIAIGIRKHGTKAD